MNKRLLSFSALIVSYLTGSPTAWACSVCFGDPDSPASKALTVAVLFLMGVIGVLLIAIAATSVIWYRRSTKSHSPELSHTS